MDDKPKICFDKDYKIRILDPEKAAHAEELNSECSTFIEKISDFNGKINGLVEVLELHAKRIDGQKLRAIGLRMACENEAEERTRQQRLLQNLIIEKRTELDRVTSQCQSLERIEAEQRANLDRMSSIQNEQK